MNKLKKGNIILAITIIILLTGGILLVNIFAGNKKGFMPKGGVVPNEETAIKIAEAVWYPIYGDNIYSKQPFKAEYNAIEQCWRVFGTLPKMSLGGVPEIKINKADGRILYVYHDK